MNEEEIKEFLKQYNKVYLWNDNGTKNIIDINDFNGYEDYPIISEYIGD